MFHTHDYKTMSQFFTEPYQGKWEVTGMSVESMEKILFGFTTIVQQCEDCGELKTTEIIGKVTNMGIAEETN